MTIDKDKLRELASDSTKKTREVFEELGFNNYATFNYHLSKDPEAQKIFEEARAAAAGSSSNTSEAVPARQRRASARAPRKNRQSAISNRGSKRTTPPRKPRSANGKNGNGGISDKLLRRVAHELEHIALYDSYTDQFAETVAEFRKALK